MNSEVNIKYILGLEEQKDKTLQVIKIDIADSSVIIEELEAMQENPNRNLYDMSSYFYRQVRPIENCYNFCFPKEYFYSYLNEKITPVPCDINYWEYREKEEKRRRAWEKTLYSNKDLTEEEKENKWNTYVHRIEYSEKKKYFSQAQKYILCQNLYLATQVAKSNSHIKVYSRDDVGWNNFLYDVNDDVKIDVYTNFGYGGKAFFYLSIKYKDIILIPYSDLVHYYLANMKSLISHTRAYRPYRDSWAGLMDYVAKFVNNARRDPENFVRNYVLNEIHEMMDGLRAVLKNPSKILEHMQKDNGEEIRLSVIRPFDKHEFVIFEALPKELTTVFKIEKISGALHFIENLKSLKDICSEVDSAIDEIIEMNKSVAQEIPSVIESINASIIPLQNEYNNLSKVYNVKITEKERLEKILERRLSYCKTWDAQEKCKEIFKKQVPRYEVVENEIRELDQIRDPLYTRIKRRCTLRQRLTDSQSVMDLYINHRVSHEK